MTRWAWWCNLHGDTVSHRAHWDVLHLQRALDSLGFASVEAHPAQVDWDNPPPSVVLIAGQHHTSDEDVVTIQRVLAALERPVVIVTSDEASLFPWADVHRDGITWWISTPRRSVHGDMPDGTRFFGEGAGPPVSLPPVAKDLDVYFAGQATHRSRRELVGVLQAMDPERVVCEPTAGFMQGRPRAGYLSQMARARVVPCPAGAATVDSFRLYEALELGCVPIVENLDPRGVDEGTWRLMYGPAPLPFPVLDSWAQLPDFLPYLLHDFDRISRECQAWWRDRQADLVTWLAEDTAPPA